MSEICEVQSQQDLRAIHDTMDVLSGKWKISILSSICFYNKRRFSQILADIPKISNRMLSKELKDLEMNLLIKRTVLDTQPVTVEYQLTEYGLSLQNIIKDLAEWGKEHRRVIIEK